MSLNREEETSGEEANQIKDAEENEESSYLDIRKYQIKWGLGVMCVFCFSEYCGSTYGMHWYFQKVGTHFFANIKANRTRKYPC